MSTITATRRRRRFGVAGIAAAAAIGAASLMPAASAAPVDITAPITGSLNVGGDPGEIPAGTTFTGTWDDEAFTFQGDLDFPASSTTMEVDGVGTVTIGLQISATSQVTGSWDPDAGTAEASVTLSLELTDVSLVPAPFTDCIAAPIDLDLTGLVTYEGADDEAGDPGYPVLTLQSGFTIPPVTPATACNELAPIINGVLAPPVQDNSTEMVLSFAPDQDIPTPTTTTVPAETTTTEAPADPADPPAAGGTATPATPVAATPSYTG